MDIQKINLYDNYASFESIIRCPPLRFSEVEEYVEEFECRLLYQIYRDEDDLWGNEKIIGRLWGYHFSLNACYRDFDRDKKSSLYPIDLFNMICDETARLMDLFEDSLSIKLKYLKKWQNTNDIEFSDIQPNIILIKHVEVLGKYRGKKFGKTLIFNSLCTIGRKNDLVIVDPAPLQFLSKSKEKTNRIRK